MLSRNQENLSTNILSHIFENIFFFSSEKTSEIEKIFGRKSIINVKG